MSEKRRDNKGRVLKTGETQRPDGRYEFKFTDLGGKRRTIYSWRLVETDKIPTGKRDSMALRDAEAKILRDIQDGVDQYMAMRITLNQYWESYLKERCDIRPTTLRQYRGLYGKYIESELGTRPLAKIRFEDIKSLYLRLLGDGRKPSSVRAIQAMLHPVFKQAVRSGYMRINPTDGVVAELRRTHNWTQTKRHALTEQEQEALVDFVATSAQFSRYLSLVTVLLGTGMRIGECTGLRWEDVDFAGNTISVNHVITIYKSDGETKQRAHIGPTKTQAGTRKIPMLAEVRSALLNERLYQMEHGTTPDVIDGYSGFIFQNTKRRVMMPYVAYNILRDIVKTYNALAEANGDPPLPRFSAHNLRHTFCTRFCENETNIKVIQEIMGHASAQVTMDIYNEATKEKKAEAMKNLEGKMKIG